MASWNPSALVSTCISLSDIQNASVQHPGEHSTPVLKLIADARAKGYDLVCMPLTNEKWKNRWRDMCLLPPNVEGKEKERVVLAEQRAEAWRAKPAFAHDEVTMTRLDEAEGVTVMVSDWLELDAVDDWIRNDAELALQQELAYASYLNVQTAILPPPRVCNRAYVASYARAVNGCLTSSSTPYIQLSIRLPIYDPSIFHTAGYNNLSTSSSLRSSPTGDSLGSFPTMSSSGLRITTSPPADIGYGSAMQVDASELPNPRRGKATQAHEDELNSTWEMWDIIRSICGYNPRLSLTLDLTPPLPSVQGVLSRWEAEPTRHIFLPASAFLANAKGYPVLPKGTQTFIRDFFKHRPTVIFSGTDAGIHSRGGEAAYSQYVRHLEKSSPGVRARETEGTVENFAQGYQDYLQAPLQPLMDNLQSVTYQTFEQDPVKYQKYEEAVYKALKEWPTSDRIVICIAGAGRGPLVARCLTAAERARRTVFVYAIEKNPNAFVTLQHRQETEWEEKVTIVFGDMRLVDVPEKADILVSELLGSFGDNELSPECLDGAMRFLKPEGISIPSSYTAHLAPLSSSKLYNEACVGKDMKSAETPYVVMFQAVNILSGQGGGIGGRCGPQIQECWEFEHPRAGAVLDVHGLPFTNSHNARSATLTFHIPHAGVLHGLAGYFESVLYGNVGLSIHPHRKDQVSKDMLSWFPLYFPFNEPLYLPSNSELQVSIWRLTNKRQVWYEWYAESFLPVSNLAAVPMDEAKRRPSSPFLNGQGSFLATPATPAAMPSPLIDAIDSPWPSERSTQQKVVDETLKTDTRGVVKIGQTSLHNPGGRSSWIGL